MDEREAMAASPRREFGDDRPRAFVAGVYWWNHPTIRALFTSHEGPPVFYWSYDDAIEQAQAAGGCVVGWSSRLLPSHIEKAAAAGVTLWRIEDGFVRSVGLGAGFVTAASLSVDRRGIYYDARTPSDLEYRLQHQAFDDAQRQEGARIRAHIVAARLSKYNLAGRESPIGTVADGRKVILVPGQVSDDASIMSAASSVIDLRAAESVNEQLLRSVRDRNPDAFLIFKPHPDVQANLRNGHVPRDRVMRYADMVVESGDIIGLLEQCDAVETISSLVGFEALLRGRPVTTYGTPFYAGWGLTTDHAHFERRGVRRQLDELIYCAFAEYTRHVNPLTGKQCSIHELIDALMTLKRSSLHRWRTAILQRFAWACEFGKRG